MSEPRQNGGSARAPYAHAAADAEGVARVLGGDAQAYAALVHRHQDRLYRHALGMVQDEDAAADLVQDALVKAYANLSDCRDHARFGIWVYRILRNRCLDYLKDLRRNNVSLDGHVLNLPSSQDPDRDLERSRTGEVLRRALGRLPEVQREAFLLRHVEGYGYQEMAEMLAISESAAKMRVHRAREALQELLADDGPAEVTVSQPGSSLERQMEAPGLPGLKWREAI